MQLKDNLEGTSRNEATYLTLMAARESLKNFFGLKRLPLIQSQDVKRALRKGVDDKNATQQLYPYAYFSIADLGLNTERQNPKTINRNSMTTFLSDLTNSSVSKAFLFPSVIQIEFHYVTNDLPSAILFAERAMILTSTGKLNIEAEHEGVRWLVGITSDSKSVPFPRSDKDNEEDPEGMDLTIQFTLNSYVGRTKDVAKINNRGEITHNTEVRNGR